MGDEFNKLGAWEEAWQKAFEGSEHTPPARVWQGLENSLMEQQLHRYKRKLRIYQWLAAASVMLLGLWVGWWLMLSQPQENTFVAQQSQPTGTANTQTKAKSSPELEGSKNAEQLFELQNKASASTNNKAETTLQIPKTTSGSTFLSPNISTAGVLPLRSAPYAVTSPSVSLSGLRTPLFLRHGLGTAYSPFFQDMDTEDHGDENNELMIAFLPNVEGVDGQMMLQAGDVKREIRVVPNNKRGRKKNSIFPEGTFWLGASIGRNTFDPNVGAGNSYSLYMAEQGPPGKGSQVYTANVSAWDEMEESLPSLDFKIDAAYQISKRWMVQSSLQYNTFKVKTLTGTYTDPNTQKTYPLYYTNFSSDKLQPASAYSRNAMPVTSLTSYNFLSVPVTLNYVLFDQKFGLAVNTGVSSEIFIGGRIRDQYSELYEYKIEAGSGSPFRKVHMNAIVGGQLFYRASHRHVLTLEPSFRYAISDFNRRSYYFNSRPKQFGIAAGFRFILH